MYLRRLALVVPLRVTRRCLATSAASAPAVAKASKPARAPRATAKRGMEITSSDFGTHPGTGAPVTLYTLKNGLGLEASVTNFGATLVSVRTPGAGSPAPQEVTLNHRSLAGLLKNDPYMGVTVGRYANRIARGAFSLDGKSYALAANNGPNSLHGGLVGYDKRVWTLARVTASPSRAAVVFALDDPAGAEGFPGAVRAEAEFALTKGNALELLFRATADAPTVVNLCNHAYWNLSGDLARDVRGHALALDCAHYIPIDGTAVPLPGAPAPVAGTPFDFHARARALGERLDGVDGAGAPGYDHCFVRASGLPGADGAPPAAAGTGGRRVERIAVLEDAAGGRKMTVSTDAPGVQVYTGNWLGPGPAPHKAHWAVCLETQAFPDSPNRPDYPSAVLRPGQAYAHSAIHEFEWTV